MHDQFYFALVNPIIAWLLSAGFAATWWRWPSQRHLATLALAFFCLGLGFVLFDLKLLAWPGEVNIGANALYVAAIALACICALQRRNQPLPVLWFLIVIAAGALPFAWFLFVEPSVQARMLVMSAIFAGLTGITLRRMKQQPATTLPDRMIAVGVGLAFLATISRPALVLAGILGVEGPEGFSSSEYWASIRAFTPLVSFGVAGLVVGAMALDVIEHIKDQAERDHLTGLLNRRGFERSGTEAISRDFASSRQPAVLVADIDNFKRVNDTYGHKAGDTVIAGVAKVLTDHGHAQLAGRIGGEEFALYYNNVSRNELLNIASSIKAELDEVSFSGLPPDYRVTLSMGLHLSYSLESLGDMLMRADQALYRAKRGGKARAVLTPVQLHLTPGMAARA